MSEPDEQMQEAFRLLDKALEAHGTERDLLLACALRTYQEARGPARAYPDITSDVGASASNDRHPPAPSPEET